jgi:hypothetical protein
MVKNPNRHHLTGRRSTRRGAQRHPAALEGARSPATDGPVHARTILLTMPGMSAVAWSMAVVLVGLLVFGVVVAGLSPVDLAVPAAGFGVWLGVGLWVRADARRLGVSDDRALKFMLWGLLGFLWWLGYRQARLEATPTGRYRSDIAEP